MTIYVLKEVSPNRQKILVDGQEMRLGKWANRKAAGAIGELGGDRSGPDWQMARDNLIQEALANPQEHGIQFLDGAPEGAQTELSEPDIEGDEEQTAIEEGYPPEAAAPPPDPAQTSLRDFVTRKSFADAWFVLKQQSY
jgi:hypothetical protein